jgi:hypothetical protein
VHEPEKDRVDWIHPKGRDAYAEKLVTSTAIYHAGKNKENLDSDTAFVEEDEGKDCL